MIISLKIKLLDEPVLNVFLSVAGGAARVGYSFSHQYALPVVESGAGKWDKGTGSRKGIPCAAIQPALAVVGKLSVFLQYVFLFGKNK